MPHLFTPLKLGSLELANRIVIAPMCQYSAQDGKATDWHMIHLGHLALSGAGLMILEATAVSARGRISPADLGLYSDEDEAALARVLEAIRTYSPIPIAIQLAHAGRKGFEPRALGRRRTDQFRRARRLEDGGALAGAARGGRNPARGARSRRPRRACATSSPRRRSARRDSASTESRSTARTAICCINSCRRSPTSVPTSTAAASRTACGFRWKSSMRCAPYSLPEKPVWMRISATDWVPNGWDIDGTVALSKALKARGCAAIHVTTGGVSPQQAIKIGPGYQVPYAQRVKAEVGLPTIAVGLITEPEQAEAIIANGEADAVSLARAMLYDPRWPWHAAAKLGAKVGAPKQYWRSQPREYSDLFENTSYGQR